jgi:hypothetical protein
MSNGFDDGSSEVQNVINELNNDQNKNAFDSTLDQEIKVEPVNVIPVVVNEPVNVIPVVINEPVNVIPIVNPVSVEPVHVNVEPQVPVNNTHHSHNHSHKRKKDVKNKEYLGGENLNQVYLSANFNEMIEDFKEIKIKLLTKDQGWASVPDSNSWFDLRITNSNGQVLAEKHRIVQNHTVTDYQKKKFELKRNDHDLGAFMNGDNRLELVARSQYPGWEIHVKKASMKFDD